MLCTTATNTSNTIRTQTGAAVSLIRCSHSIQSSDEWVCCDAVCCAISDAGEHVSVWSADSVDEQAGGVAAARRAVRVPRQTQAHVLLHGSRRQCRQAVAHARQRHAGRQAQSSAHHTGRTCRTVLFTFYIFLLHFVRFKVFLFLKRYYYKNDSTKAHPHPCNGPFSWVSWY